MESVKSTKRAAPAPQSERTADVLVDVLVEHGVEQVFALPGGPISPILDSLVDRPHVRVTTTRHESGAVFAAAAYAQTTGRLGVAVVTSGPGVMNALTAMASAWCDGLPVLLLVGECARRNMGRGGLQDGSAHHLNVVGMYQSITKLAMQLGEPTGAVAVLRRAIATALSGRQGPVMLTLPVDSTMTQVPHTQIELAVHVEQQLSRPALLQAAGWLRDKGRVAIFAGSGARRGRGPELLRAVAERLQLPVMTTPKAKGVFPEDHPLALGVFGVGGHLSASAFVQGGVDVLLVLGSSLGELQTEGWSRELEPKKALLQVDIDALQIGRAYPVTMGIAAPVETFLYELLSVLPPAQSTPRRFGVRSHVLSEPYDLLSPQRALCELQQVLAPDTLYTVDAGEHALFAVHFLRLRQPDSWVWMSGLGSMGSSVGAAVGLQSAHRSRPVAAICGDGCFAMNAAEVATAVQERLPIRVFVFNDRRLGMVEIGHQSVYGRSPGFSTGPLDVQLLARGFGADAALAEQPGDLLALADRLRDRSRALVVDVRIDPTAKMPKRERIDPFGVSPKQRK